MKRYSILATFLLCVMCVAFAQGTVKGKVKDKATKQNMEFVNVTISQIGTTKYHKGKITDASGNFKITGISYGSYTLTANYVGYGAYTKNITISAKNKNLDLGTIFLSEDAQVLKEVTVVGAQSTIRLDVDKKTFNADQIITAAGGTASDLLENIPSVEVDQEGEVSLRGSTSVEVWINGKPSGLTSENRGEILQQMPAESIEKIEVITNPGAKYSAEGSAGIINIILKRDRKAGYYGSVRSGVNTSGSWNLGGNINYSSGVLDAYANIGYRSHQSTNSSFSNQDMTLNNTFQNYTLEGRHAMKNIFSRLGLTWHPTEKDDIYFSGMGSFGKRDNRNDAVYHNGIYDEGHNPVENNTMFRHSSGDGDMRMMHVEGGYTHRFAEEHSLDVNLSYNIWNNDDDALYRDSTIYKDFPQNTLFNYMATPQRVRTHSWEARLDYMNRFNDRWSLEAGYNGDFNRENTPQEEWDADNWGGAGAVENYDAYNRFIYNQDIHALYGTLTTKFGHLGVKAGLRGEYWKVFTESYYKDMLGKECLYNDYKKDNFQLFPSLFLSYELSNSQDLQLNVTRRLRRPWGGQLNSFKNKRDASIINYGNPELTPEYTWAFELNYLKNWQMHTLSLSAYYRPTTDVMQRINYQNSTDGMMYASWFNVAKSQSTGLEIIGKDRFGKWLDLTTTVNLYYYKLNAFSYDIDGQTVIGDETEKFTWNARMIANFILPWDLTIQTIGNLNSRQATAQGYVRSSYGISLGLRKNLFNKKLVFAVNCRDLLDSRKRTFVSHGTGFERYQEMRWSSRKVMFTLTWNFGNMKQKKPQREDNGEEQMDMMDSYNGVM